MSHRDEEITQGTLLRVENVMVHTFDMKDIRYDKISFFGNKLITVIVIG